MKMEPIRDIGFIICIALSLYVAHWSIRRDKRYWTNVAHVTGLSPSQSPNERIAANLQWFTPYIELLNDQTVSTVTVSELEGTQHNHQTSLAMYEIHQKILGTPNGPAFFCVQRFSLRTIPPQLFVIAKTTPFLQATFTVPESLHTSHNLTDFTVTCPEMKSNDLWTKLEPIWQGSYNFCAKQKLGLLVEDGYLFLYSPYRPVDLKLWIEFSNRLLTVIDD